MAVLTDEQKGKKHCALHDVWYGQLEQCAECRKSRGISVKAASPKTDVKELQLLADEYRAEDKFLRRVAREWLTDGTAKERRDALEAIKTAARCASLFKETHLSIKELEHDHWLVEQKRLLGSGGN